MAISRAQLLKELLPGLNALFGLEYASYGEEHKELFEIETSERSFEEETKLSGFNVLNIQNIHMNVKNLCGTIFYFGLPTTIYKKRGH